MTDQNSTDIYAEVVMRPRTDASLLRDAVRVTPQRLNVYEANVDCVEELVARLKQVGLTVIAYSKFGVSISGPRKLFQEFFQVQLLERKVQMLLAGGGEIETGTLFMDQAPKVPNEVAHLAETVYIPRKGYLLAGEGAMPNPPYYCLRPPTDISRLTHADEAHNRGFRGTGVKVGMVDTGFIADHDYYAGRGYHITVHAAVGSAQQDEIGHGTGIASNLLAVAPDCDFHFFKMTTNYLDWASVAAFRMAVQEGCRVITNSWGQPRDPVLEAEIVSAVASGITVIFASGNGGPVGWPGCLTEVISVGGAYAQPDGTWVASSYASSGTNSANPTRQCPDLCGIVGQAPRGIFIVMPTMRGSELDSTFGGGVFPNGDQTGAADGWLVASGTSSAAPQVAGAAALLLQAKPSLTPAEVKQALQDTSIDITQGLSAHGDPAGTGVDDATGTGVIDVAAAINHVNPITVCRVAPMIRACPPAPIVVCRVAPMVRDCPPAPIRTCPPAPVILCPVAPVRICPSAPMACPPAPVAGCAAGPELEPWRQPRERVVRPREATSPQAEGTLWRGQGNHLVPIIVMVDEQVASQLMQTSPSSPDQSSAGGDGADWPGSEGYASGSFNPSAA